MPRPVLLVVLLAAACTSAVTPSASVDADGAAGGVLRAGIWVPEEADDQWQMALLDPQAFMWHPLFRCCLLRTLLSYRGVSILEGGAQLQPDLAEAMPQVSADGLTWTFRLRDGLTYAPPLAERAILARDFITALERAIRRGESPYHDVIDGVQAFRDGEADTIAGVQAPDDLTLVFRLNEPIGDFANRVAMHYLAPIPEEALRQHDEEYAGHLVASGPYMLEGADTIALSDPDAGPIWEGRPLGELTLVRNPSWSRDLDPLRPTYVDRIEIVPIRDRGSASRAIQDGEIDLFLDGLFADEYAEVAADPTLRPRLREAPFANLFFIPLNLAQPPFDDVAVRRAVNLVVDRQSLLGTFDPQRGAAFAPAAHLFPEVSVGGLLRDYVPAAASTDGRSNVAGAREEMTRSGYDTDGDGRCDGSACTIVANRYGPTTDSAVEILAANLAEIGIEVSWVDEPVMWDPTAHVALMAILGWTADYPSANDFAGLLTEPAPDALNLSLVGATSDQLASWGYDEADVPSVDDKIASCQSRGGSAAFACWAELDQLLMEQVVPWVPIATSVGAWLVSDRIDRFEIAGSSADPALERITLRTETLP
ncbi:MAG TPA: ABC transporter substrate-binding protein [Candidatus Limnocylindria bacterium]